MKILIIHQFYLQPGQPGGSRFNEFARLWSEAGHEVTVLAGSLNYATGETPEHLRGHWLKEEQDGQVKVLRCHVPSSYSKSFRGRMWAFFAYTLSASSGVLVSERPDIIIATSPPLVAAIPGWLASRFRWSKVPWIFEVRDLWPESAVTTGVLSEKSPLTRVLYGLERLAYRSASRINVLTPAFQKNIAQRGLAPNNKIVFVPNGADTGAFTPGERDNHVRQKYNWGDRFVVMYTGAHGRANAVGQLIDTAVVLKDRPDILIASVGDGPERKQIEERAQELGLNNIQFLGAQAKEAMPDFVRACDVGAAVLQDNPTFRTVYPNKVFDYMACSRPTLLAIDGVAREMVCDQAEAGVFAKPENAQDIAEKICWLADHPKECEKMGNRGHDWVHANAARPALAKRYLNIMQEMITGANS